MTHNEIEPVLRSIVEKSTLVNFIEYNNILNYIVELRTRLVEGEVPSKQCDIWVKKFSAITNSSWIVKNTSPAAVRLLYKKCYTCKQKGCSAKMTFTFKKNNRNTRKNDPLLEKGLSCIIKICFKHNHNIYCPGAEKIKTKNVNENIDDDDDEINDCDVSSTHDFNSNLDDNEHSIEIQYLRNEFSRIVDILQKNNSALVTQNIIIFRKKLEEISEVNINDFWCVFK